MRILATYTGRSSGGYIQGSTYKLRVHGSMIRREDGSIGNGGERTYNSLRSFLTEWSMISVFNDGP